MKLLMKSGTSSRPAKSSSKRRLISKPKRLSNRNGLDPIEEFRQDDQTLMSDFERMLSEEVQVMASTSRKERREKKEKRTSPPPAESTTNVHSPSQGATKVVPLKPPSWEDASESKYTLPPPEEMGLDILRGSPEARDRSEELGLDILRGMDSLVKGKVDKKPPPPPPPSSAPPTSEPEPDTAPTPSPLPLLPPLPEEEASDINRDNVESEASPQDNIESTAASVQTSPTMEITIEPEDVRIKVEGLDIKAEDIHVTKSDSMHNQPAGDKLKDEKRLQRHLRRTRSKGQSSERSLASSSRSQRRATKFEPRAMQSINSASAAPSPMEQTNSSNNNGDGLAIESNLLDVNFMEMLEIAEMFTNPCAITTCFTEAIFPVDGGTGDGIVATNNGAADNAPAAICAPAAKPVQMQPMQQMERGRSDSRIISRSGNVKSVQLDDQSSTKSKTRTGKTKKSSRSRRVYQKISRKHESDEMSHTKPQKARVEVDKGNDSEMMTNRPSTEPDEKPLDISQRERTEEAGDAKINHVSGKVSSDKLVNESEPDEEPPTNPASRSRDSNENWSVARNKQQPNEEIEEERGHIPGLGKINNKYGRSNKSDRSIRNHHVMSGLSYDESDSDESDGPDNELLLKSHELLLKSHELLLTNPLSSKSSSRSVFSYRSKAKSENSREKRRSRRQKSEEDFSIDSAMIEKLEQKINNQRRRGSETIQSNGHGIRVDQHHPYSQEARPFVTQQYDEPTYNLNHRTYSQEVHSFVPHQYQEGSTYNDYYPEGDTSEYFPGQIGRVDTMHFSRESRQIETESRCEC